MPSSRTPEGEPNRCHVCGSVVVIAPSTFPAPDAPCPVCGSLLWFAASSESSRPAEPRFTLPPQSPCLPTEPAKPPPALANQRTATFWTRLAAIELDVKVPRPLGMFACGLLLMAFIELLLWLHSGAAPEFDRGAVLSHSMMALMICGTAEVFRTDGRHNRWHMLECRVGLGCATVAGLAFALFGLYYGEPSLTMAGFVLLISFVAGMMVLFLTIGVLAMSAHALELLLRLSCGRSVPSSL